MKNSPRPPRCPRARRNKAIIVTCLCLVAIIGATAVNKKARRASEARKPVTVRTTAYTHTESDHLVYGRQTAIGTTLQAGRVNSAAADWSFMPVGTKFRIVGDKTLYEVDDYGSALVGTETVDIYRPSRSSMNTWGVRHVDIRIVERGSVEKSIEVLKDRTAYRHCREMLERLRATVDA